jgi:hypothetical protein
MGQPTESTDWLNHGGIVPTLVTGNHGDCPYPKECKLYNLEFHHKDTKASKQFLCVLCASVVNPELFGLFNSRS